MNNLKEIQKQIDDIITATRQKGEKLQGHLNAATKSQAESTAAFITAQQTGDPKAYAAAAVTYRENKDIAEMYFALLNKQQISPRINGDQYSTMKAQTIAAMDKLNNAAKERIMKALAEIEAVRDELAPALDHGMAILNQIELLHAPLAQPKVDYTYKGKDGGRLNILATVDAIMTTVQAKYIMEVK